MSQPLINRDAITGALAAVKKKLNIKKMDAFVRANESNSFSAVGQDKCEMDYLVQASLRIWTERGIGLAVTTDTSEEGLLAAAKSALETGAVTQPSDYDYHPQLSGAPVTIADLKDQLVSPDKLRNDLLGAIESATAGDKSITLPYSQSSQSVVQRLYANSEGQSHYNAYIATDVYFQARVMSDQNIARTAAANKVVKRYSALDQTALAREAVANANFRKRHIKIETGSYAVVFSPHAMLSLLGGFSSMFSGQSVAEKQSLLSPENLGALIASPLLNISDTPTSEQNARPVWFSGEGERTEDTSIIRDGRLEAFLHSRLSAKLLGATSNGHGSFGAKPGCSPYFLSVAAGKDKSAADGKAFFKDRPSVYVDRVQSLHAGINARQGSFSLPFEGRYIKDGVETSIEAAVVAGDFRSLLQNIAFVGSIAVVENHGICPEIGVPDLKVTGR